MSRANGTVVLFLGKSNFGNIGWMVPALADGFGEVGFDPVIIDIRRAGHEDRLFEVIGSREVVAFISVRRAVRIFNEADVPMLVVFLDHPFCLHHRVDLPLKNYHATFPSGHAGHVLGMHSSLRS